MHRRVYCVLSSKESSTNILVVLTLRNPNLERKLYEGKGYFAPILVIVIIPAARTGLATREAQ